MADGRYVWVLCKHVLWGYFTPSPVVELLTEQKVYSNSSAEGNTAILASASPSFVQLLLAFLFYFINWVEDVMLRKMFSDVSSDLYLVCIPLRITQDSHIRIDLRLETLVGSRFLAGNQIIEFTLLPYLIYRGTRTDQLASSFSCHPISLCSISHNLTNAHALSLSKPI